MALSTDWHGVERLTFKGQVAAFGWWVAAFGCQILKLISLSCLLLSMFFVGRQKRAPYYMMIDGYSYIDVLNYIYVHEKYEILRLFAEV